MLVAAVLAIGAAGAIYWTQTDATEAGNLPEGRVVSAASCLAPNIVAAAMPGASTTAVDLPDAPEAGTLPSGFSTVSLVVCEFAGDTPDGTMQILRQTERSGENLADALALLSTATDTPRNPDNCSTVGSAPIPAVWAVDVRGAAVHLALPRDGCGQLKNDPVTAIEQVPVLSVENYELPSAY